MKEVGVWWNDKEIELVEIEGSVYALYGWNGEDYGKWWRCTGEFLTEASEEEYTLKPVYKQVDEDEWEIVDYEVSEN